MTRPTRQLPGLPVDWKAERAARPLPVGPPPWAAPPEDDADFDECQQGMRQAAEDAVQLAQSGELEQAHARYLAGQALERRVHRHHNMLDGPSMSRYVDEADAATGVTVSTRSLLWPLFGARPWPEFFPLVGPGDQ